MSYKTLNNLIKILIQKYQIEVYLDKRSEISNFVLSNLNTENVSVINPKDKSELFSMIKNIEYGLFMDSGPLHIAKMFKRRGLLLETSVASNILLKNYKLIKGIKNNFSSPFCKAPCGLTDIFNYDSRYGCYDSLSITSEKLKSNKFKNMISRGVKNYYLKNTINPVNCVSALNVQNIHYAISKDLSL